MQTNQFDRTARSAPIAEPPATSPALFWAIVLSSVGTFAVGSAAMLVSGRGLDAAASTGGVWRVVAVEVLLVAVWLPVLRRRGWSLACTTMPPVTRDLTRALGLMALCYGAAWLVFAIGAAIHPGSQPWLHETRSGVPLGFITLLVISVVNPLAEEFLYLGFIANVLRRRGAYIAAAASVAARALLHTYQGPLRLVSIVVVGIVLTVYYLRTSRLWPVVFAHGFIDALGLASVGAHLTHH